MGQGQQALAIQKLRECSSQGTWLCLQNLHLVSAWLPTLVHELSVALPKANASFRLWLTADVHGKLPATLLAQSVKVKF